MADAGKAEFDKNVFMAFDQLKSGAISGIRLATALVKKESQKNAPVDEGVLKAAHYTNVEVNRGHVLATVGVAVDYAAAVHEILNPSSGVPRPSGKGNFWDTGGPKFLENAISDNRNKILQLMRGDISL